MPLIIIATPIIGKINIDHPFRIPINVIAARISNIPMISNQNPDAMLPSKETAPLTKAKKTKNLKNGKDGYKKIAKPIMISIAAKNLLGNSRDKKINPL